MGIRSEKRQLHEHFTIKPAACCSRVRWNVPDDNIARRMDARHSLQWKTHHPRVSPALLHSLLPYNDDKCDSLLVYTYEQVRRLLVHYTVSLHASWRKFYVHSALCALYKMFNFISRLELPLRWLKREISIRDVKAKKIVKFRISNKLYKLLFKYIFCEKSFRFF